MENSQERLLSQSRRPSARHIPKIFPLSPGLASPPPQNHHLSPFSPLSLSASLPWLPLHSQHTARRPDTCVGGNNILLHDFPLSAQHTHGQKCIPPSPASLFPEGKTGPKLCSRTAGRAPRQGAKGWKQTTPSKSHHLPVVASPILPSLSLKSFSLTS